MKRILTGDRPTGKLHLGHYVGSLYNRVKLQNEYDTFIIVADVQALTTNFDKPENLNRDIHQIVEDYLAVGLSPDKCTFFVQSMVPQIAELTMFYSMFVTVNSLRHNPTIKTEAKERGYNDMYYGFLGYPVSQAADITFCKADLVPVGDDQVPHVEQTRKIVRRFNELYKPVFPEPEALVGEIPRLAGLDGKLKMSKSYGNAIYLSDSPEDVMNKIKNAVTDPERIKATDPGHPDVCTVFEYHKAFNKENLAEVEESCKKGTIGCVACKKNLACKINETLEPMHERRIKYTNNPKLIDQILIDGTSKAVKVGSDTMKEVRDAMYINYFK